ncbi:hypothetical protein KKH36_00425 [Patescibacteria group bacterium]|nr:hypothetical protein [Patescibacteria group bacterium]
MRRENKIYISDPKPFQNVGARFLISGNVPLSWLKTPYGFSRDISLELIDIKAQTILGSNISVGKVTLLSRLFGYITFKEVFQFNQFNVGFIKESQGRMTIKLSGQSEKEQSIFIPIIVKELEPEKGADQEILERHGKIGKVITQYEDDLKNYYAELSKIYESRKQKSLDTEQHIHGKNIGIAVGILDILEKSEDSFEDYLYSENDKKEKELEDRYKDALEWRGPLLKGLVSDFQGFELRVYSDDHDKHFHVIHRGKKINARFSFPDIQLLNYAKYKNTISSKQEKKIREYCLQPEILKKFEEEFEKREA